jgi:hypothetical protein
MFNNLFSTRFYNNILSLISSCRAPPAYVRIVKTKKLTPQLDLNHGLVKLLVQVHTLYILANSSTGYFFEAEFENRHPGKHF